MASTGQASSHMPQIDAAQLVDREAFGIFLAVGPGAFGGHDVDAMGRAGRGAQEAGHALHAPLGVLVQPMHAAIDQRIANLRPRFRKADRHLGREQMARRGASAPAGTAANTSCPPAPACGSSIHFTAGSLGFMSVPVRAIEVIVRNVGRFVAVDCGGPSRRQRRPARRRSPAAHKHATSRQRGCRRARPAPAGCVLGHHGHGHQVDHAQRQHHLPGQRHQLIEAEPGPAPAHHHEEHDHAP